MPTYWAKVYYNVLFISVCIGMQNGLYMCKYLHMYIYVFHVVKGIKVVLILTIYISQRESRTGLDANPVTE